MNSVSTRSRLSAVITGIMLAILLVSSAGCTMPQWLADLLGIVELGDRYQGESQYIKDLMYQKQVEEIQLDYLKGKQQRLEQEQQQALQEAKQWGQAADAAQQLQQFNPADVKTNKKDTGTGGTHSTGVGGSSVGGGGCN